MPVGIGGHDFVDIGSVLFGVLFKFVAQRMVPCWQAVICCTLKNSEMLGLGRDDRDGLNAG